MAALNYRLELSEIVPAADQRTVDVYLADCSKDMLLKTGSYLLAYDKSSPAIRDNRKFLGDFFNQDNNRLANTIYGRIRQIETERNWSVIVANNYTSLKLIEHAVNKRAEHRLTNTQTEQNVFNAYLLLNELDNAKDGGVLDSLTDKQGILHFPLLILTQTFRYSDINGANYQLLFADQFTKAILFFQFIEEKYPAILTAYLAYFNCNTWQRYMQKMFPLISPMSKVKKGFTRLTINPGPTYEEDIDFLNKFSIGEESEELIPYDFVSIRSKPIFKIDDHTYQIIFDQFLYEKIFNGIYFTMRTLPALATVDLNNIFSLEFCEKTLLYKQLNRLFAYKATTYTGHQLEKDFHISGAPDYYAKVRNNVYVFESKNIMLDAKIKEAGNYQAYETEIKKKLYFDVKVNETTGEEKIKPKAILQLIRSIEKLLDKSSEVDTIKNTARIYPIIVVHNQQFDVPGLSHLLNHWFFEELAKLAAKGLETKNVRPVTLMNISTLIFYNDQFRLGQLRLAPVLNEYHQSSKLNYVRTRPGESLEDNLMDKVLPFGYFIKKRAGKAKMPAMLRKLAKSFLRY